MPDPMLPPKNTRGPVRSVTDDTESAAPARTNQGKGDKPLEMSSMTREGRLLGQQKPPPAESRQGRDEWDGSTSDSGRQEIWNKHFPLILGGALGVAVGISESFPLGGIVAGSAVTLGLYALKFLWNLAKKLEL